MRPRDSVVLAPQLDVAFPPLIASDTRNGVCLILGDLECLVLAIAENPPIIRKVVDAEAFTGVGPTLIRQGRRG